MIGLVLCGGEGTRLQGHIPFGMPKCLVPVGGRAVWEYALMAAEQVCDGSVVVAPGPSFAMRRAVREVTGKYLLESERDGTVVLAARTRSGYPTGLAALAVFNGDTLLFGDVPAVVTMPNEIAEVLGRDFITGQAKVAIRFIGGEVDLSGARNLEDLPARTVESQLTFIDIGTIEGLAVARRRFS